MKLSTRTRYGIRAILELAENYGNGPLHLKTIASRQGLSVTPQLAFARHRSMASHLLTLVAGSVEESMDQTPSMVTMIYAKQSTQC